MLIGNIIKYIIYDNIINFFKIDLNNIYMYYL